MENQTDVSNPITSQDAVLASGPMPPPVPSPAVQNPLAPGTTPASLSTTATPDNPAGIQLPTPSPVPSPNSSSQPAAPKSDNRSFSQKLMAAVSNVFSDLGDASAAGKNLEPGQGALSGFEKTLAAHGSRVEEQNRYNAEQTRLAQERQDKLTQEERTQKREDDEAAARIAESNANTMKIRHSDYLQGAEYMDKQVAQGQADLRSLEGNSDVPAQILQTKVSGAQLASLYQQGKFNGHEYTALPSGTNIVGYDADQKPIKEYTYDIVKVPDKWEPTDDQIARIKTVPGYEKYQKGTNLTGAQVLSVLTQADLIKSTTDAVNKSRTEAKLQKLSDEQQEKVAEFNKGGDWLKFLNANKGNSASAAQHMLTDPTMIKKYGPSLYTDVMAQFADKDDPTGTKGYETVRSHEADESIKRSEQALKQAGVADYDGNFNLTGQAFLQTIPLKSQKTVQLMGDGGIDPGSMSMLLRSKAGAALLDATLAYAPDFKPDKAKAFEKNYTDWTSTKPGSTGALINSGAQAIDTLRALYDNTNPASWTEPGSKAYKDRQADAELAVEETAKYILQTNSPGKEELDKIRTILNPVIAGLPNPVNRRESVQEVMRQIVGKGRQYDQSWANVLPSPRYQQARPDISNEAKINANYVVNGGKYSVPPGAKTAMGPNGHQIFTFDGQKFYDASNGQPLGAK